MNADNSVELTINRLVNKALSSLFVVDCYVEMQTASLNFSIASPGTWLKSQSAPFLERRTAVALLQNRIKLSLNVSVLNLDLNDFSGCNYPLSILDR